MRDDAKLGLEIDKEINKSITGRGSKVSKIWRSVTLGWTNDGKKLTTMGV